MELTPRKRARRAWSTAGLVVSWTLLGLLGFLRHFLQQTQTGGDVHFWPELFGWLPCYWAWIPLTPLVIALERRFPLLRFPWRLLAASVMFSFAAYLIRMGLVFAAPVPHLPIFPSALEFFIQESLFWMVAEVAYALRSTRELRQKQQQMAEYSIKHAELEATLRKAELQNLRMRLNPHFLFNSLQNISVLAQEDPRTASRMLVGLGDLLRAALGSTLQSEVTLDCEIKLARAYLEIEAMRLGDRLRVEIQLDPSTTGASVPSLFLQPLVENAVLHGFASAGHQGKLWIRSEAQGEQLVVSVADNGSGFPENKEPQLGVGLSSTYERLERMYPGEHAIDVTNRGEGRGAEVRISLPLRLNGMGRLSLT